MGTKVGFNPSSIDFAVVQPGGSAIQSTACAKLSAPVNVTASITGDSSGGAFTVTGIRSFINVEQPLSGDPGGPGPTKPVKTSVPKQIGESNGTTPLAVASGQYIQADVQFAPTASTPDSAKAALSIQGDTWNPVSIPLTAIVGELRADVSSPIAVVQNTSTSIKIRVTSVAGPPTTAKLAVGADGSADSPNVTISLSPKSVPVSKSSPGSSTLTVTADLTLAPGSYGWNLAVWAFDNKYSFSVPIEVNVTAPKVLGNLDAKQDPHELVRGEEVELTITVWDAKTQIIIPGLPLTASSGFNQSGENHSWEPIGPNIGKGVTGTPFKYTPFVSDNAAAAFIIGAPNYKDTELTIPSSIRPRR
jgi:hypothetical protein